MFSTSISFYCLLFTACYTLSSEVNKVIKILALVPWPDNRSNAGWDSGPSLLPAARVAVSQINSHPNILAGYRLELIEAGHEACGLTETNMVLLNYVKYASGPPNNTVAAVVGLYCSTSAAVIAEMSLPIILKFSAANSPIFESNNELYPNFWRVLTSASIYSHMMVSLMERYNWSKIAIIQDLETKFHFEIAQVLAKQLILVPNKTVTYHGGLIGTNDRYIDESIAKVKSSKTRIIFVSATGPQIAKLLCKAAKNEMYYPKFLWIIVDFIISSIIDEAIQVSDCSVEMMHSVLEGSVISYFRIESGNDDTYTLTSSFLKSYMSEYLKEVKKANISTLLEHDILYAGFLYDQIWTFSIALNNSLSQFSQNNISVEHYGFNQSLATKIIENSLLEVSFKGITGQIEFTKHREVYGCVDIYQIVNVTEVLSCSYGNVRIDLNDSFEFFDCNLTLPEALDELPVNIKVVHISVTCTLYVASLFTLLLTTAVFSLMCYYQKEPEIKSYSLSINSMIFIACYMLCLCQVISTTILGIHIESANLFSVLCNIELLVNYNSVSLISVALFVQLLRINRIFNNKKMKPLGHMYKNWFLILLALFLAFLPILLGTLLLSFFPFRRAESEIFNMEVFVQERFFYCEEKKNNVIIFILLMTVFSFIFLVFNIILASNTRSITQKEFRNSKKINCFIVSVTIIQGVSMIIIYLIRSEESVRIFSQLVNFVVAFSIAVICQVILFMPKVLATLKRKHKYH